MAVLFPLAIGGAAWTAMIWMLIIYLLASAAIGFYAAALLKDAGVERKRYIIENLYNKAKNTLNNKEDKEMVELLEDVSYNIMKRSIQNELGGIYV